MLSTVHTVFVVSQQANKAIISSPLPPPPHFCKTKMRKGGDGPSSLGIFFLSMSDCDTAQCTAPPLQLLYVHTAKEKGRRSRKRGMDLCLSLSSYSFLRTHKYKTWPEIAIDPHLHGCLAWAERNQKGEHKKYMERKN